MIKIASSIFIISFKTINKNIGMIFEQVRDKSFVLLHTLVKGCLYLSVKRGVLCLNCLLIRLQGLQVRVIIILLLLQLLLLKGLLHRAKLIIKIGKAVV